MLAKMFYLQKKGFKFKFCKCYIIFDNNNSKVIFATKNLDEFKNEILKLYAKNI